MPKITPFLWFDDRAEEAMNFYVSIFEDAKILNVSRAGEDPAGKDGAVIMATFELEGQQFMALNGGPHYTFTPACSMFVRCETQAEVDRLWEQLSEGGEPGRCGWLVDKFGLSWQIIPNILGDLMGDDDDDKAGRVREAMLGMTKIDIAGLQRAYDEA